MDDDLPRLIDAEAGRPGRPYLAAVVAAALERIAELNEAASARVRGPAGGARRAPRPAGAARLIERGLEAAARWDRADVARELTNRFLRLADEVPGWGLIET